MLQKLSNAMRTGLKDLPKRRPLYEIYPIISLTVSNGSTASWRQGWFRSGTYVLTSITGPSTSSRQRLTTKKIVSFNCAALFDTIASLEWKPCSRGFVVVLVRMKRSGTEDGQFCGGADTFALATMCVGRAQRRTRGTRSSPASSIALFFFNQLAP